MPGGDSMISSKVSQQAILPGICRIGTRPPRWWSGEDCGGSEGAQVENSRRENQEDRLRRRRIPKIDPTRIGTKDWRCRCFDRRSMVSVTEHPETRKCSSSCCLLSELPYGF